MEPINNIQGGCDPISSNCVIWQGPDISCISLCKGDNVSNVVYKLATELCVLMETFDISNYDLSCFGLESCGPKDFKSLIQLLINKICELNGITPTPSTIGAGCPDCIIAVCPAFQYTNPYGDLVTSMQLKDYVIAIGNKLCGLIGQITTINNTLIDYGDRITNLEDAPPPSFILPQLVPQCVLPPVATDIDVILAALENEFCNLRTYTGNTQDILIGIQSACQGLNDSPLLQGTGIMSSIPGWFSSPINLAQSFSNLWRTVCDMRNAITFIKNNCCNTGCDAIDLIIVGEVLNPTSLQLTFTGDIPNNYIDSVIGSTIQITDSIGGGPQIINSVNIKSNYFDTAQPYSIILTGVNASYDLNIITVARFLDPVTQNTCENLIQLTVLGADTCIPVIAVPSFDSVNYNFIWNGVVPTTITLQLWNASKTLMIQSEVLNITGNAVTGNLSNLIEGTTYNIRLLIHGEPCLFTQFTTLIHPCIAPLMLEPIINYSNPTGTTNGTTITQWQIDYDIHHP